MSDRANAHEEKGISPVERLCRRVDRLENEVKVLRRTVELLRNAALQPLQVPAPPVERPQKPRPGEPWCQATEEREPRQRQ